ncbi:hypothetical protein Ahy_A06g028053 [Arachis hypogaea]|uniref:Uncharacterized protein n=1 Tax=Arachis hypogaea TaxID=3818 RepID=A0A445CQD9_ARAHY|nr:hypothetical protein Ahy_A06g028053 [Arachis hypogaea]
MTEQQRSDISNLGKSCQQSEDALSQGMDKLQQMQQDNLKNKLTLKHVYCNGEIGRYTGRGLFTDPPSVFMSNNMWSLLLPEGFQIENLKLGNITFASRDKIFLKGRDTSELAVRSSKTFQGEASFFGITGKGPKNDGDVKIVVGDNFDDIVLDESKDVLLEISSAVPEGKGVSSSNNLLPKNKMINRIQSAQNVQGKLPPEPVKLPHLQEMHVINVLFEVGDHT